MPAIGQDVLTTLQDGSRRPPRAVGGVDLAMRRDAAGVTRIQRLRQSGSLKLVLPATHRADAEAVVVNTAGGVTGGDRLDLRIAAREGAALTLTTQAAERLYRAGTGERGRVTTRLSVARGARLRWLPQETILFDGSALARRLCVDLGHDAGFTMVEPVIFGRAAMGERLRRIDFRDRVEIRRGGRPLYLDGVRLCGDAAAHLARPAVAGGAGAMASLVHLSADAARWLEPLRACLPATGGASLRAPDLLVLRLLAADGYGLRQALLPMLDLLTDDTLPTCWRL